MAEPLTTLNGSFTAEFDNSVMTGVGLEMFEEMSILTSFNFSNNPLGSTTFDTSNVAISLYFVDGVFDALIIGGTESTANAVGAGTDDFSVIYTVLGAPILFSYSTNTDSAIHDADSITGNLTLSNTPVSQVPNPATLTLMAFGLLMLVAKRRAK